MTGSEEVLGGILVEANTQMKRIRFRELSGAFADRVDQGFVPPDTDEPVCIKGNQWYYRGKQYRIIRDPLSPPMSDEELALRLMHHLMKEADEISRIKKEVEAFRNFDRLPLARRERVPDAIRMFVWQRDGGSCVECNSRERLEFDHIIPVAEGGATTERNLQLLCEVCNRKKGRRI